MRCCMSGKRDDALLVDDMIEAASRMVTYASDVPPGCLGTDPEKADAILFNLAVLGEAAKSVSREVRSRYPGIPWAQIAMTRDKVIHHYHGIDWSTVTDIIERKLPAILPVLLRAQHDMRSGERRDH